MCAVVLHASIMYPIGNTSPSGAVSRRLCVTQDKVVQFHFPTEIVCSN